MRSSQIFLSRKYVSTPPRLTSHSLALATVIATAADIVAVQLLTPSATSTVTRILLDLGIDSAWPNTNKVGFAPFPTRDLPWICAPHRTTKDVTPEVRETILPFLPYDDLAFPGRNLFQAMHFAEPYAGVFFFEIIIPHKLHHRLPEPLEFEGPYLSIFIRFSQTRCELGFYFRLCDPLQWTQNLVDRHYCLVRARSAVITDSNDP